MNLCGETRKRRGESNINIYYDVTGLLSAVWKVTLRSTCLGCLSWPGRSGGGGAYSHGTYMSYIQEPAGSRQLDRRQPAVRVRATLIFIMTSPVYCLQCGRSHSGQLVWVA